MKKTLKFSALLLTTLIMAGSLSPSAHADIARKETRDKIIPINPLPNPLRDACYSKCINNYQSCTRNIVNVCMAMDDVIDKSFNCDPETRRYAWNYCADKVFACDKSCLLQFP